MEASSEKQQLQASSSDQTEANSPKPEAASQQAETGS